MKNELQNLVIQYKTVHPGNRPFYLEGVAKHVYAEDPTRPFEAFRHRMEGIMTMIEHACMRTAHEMPQRKRYMLEQVVTGFLYEYHGQKEPLMNKINSLLLTVRAIPGWLAQPPIRVGEYRMGTELFPSKHPEAILGFALRRNGKMLGTLGGYLYLRNGKPTFMNLNVQGVKNSREEYEALHEKINQNWRVFFMNHFLELLESHHLRVAGAHLLVTYPKPAQKLAHNKIYIRQNNQTYRKTGFKPLKNHVKDEENMWIRPARRKKR